MMQRYLKSLVAGGIVACLGLVSTGIAEDSLPWAFKAKEAEGYSIDLVSVDPAPGTPLVAGSSVEFKVAVTYSMTVADHGAIVLVFQDEANRAVKPTQVMAEVAGGSGSAALSDTVVVPRNARELRLFIPLVPAGLKETTGEITLRYPLQKGK